MLGTVSLIDRVSPGALEIGYWVPRPLGTGTDHPRPAVLTDAALASDTVEQVEIHCDEANGASATVPAGWDTTSTGSPTARSRRQVSGAGR